MSVRELPKVEKRYGTTLYRHDPTRGRRECWGARTVDGIWDIARIDDVTTPWFLLHVPTGQYVPMVSRSANDPIWRSSGPYPYRSLKAALMAIATGEAERLLALVDTDQEYRP